MLKMSWIFMFMLLHLCDEAVANCRNDFMSALGSCYHFGNVPLGFTQAEHYCRQYEGHLVHIDSAQEDSFLKTYASGHPAQFWWIGLTDLMAENHFLWIDDNTEAIFTDWGQDQPNGGIEDCIVLDHKDGYRWHDYHCETQMFPLCESKPSQIQIVG
ncbi:perlucin-like isoform X1 [Dreissena polymorpha]|uniref:perlucin-like isoform X1 n=1 Tax=Dreissena polymorpha TaxID=45954 RepID=UPI002263F947|nr:perlucin-like isoform X1 [Dreissena polymorpha]